jgi:hypothetical protein
VAYQKVLYQYFPVGTKEYHEKPVRTANPRTENGIRTSLIRSDNQFNDILLHSLCLSTLPLMCIGSGDKMPCIQNLRLLIEVVDFTLPLCGARFPLESRVGGPQRGRRCGEKRNVAPAENRSFVVSQFLCLFLCLNTSLNYRDSSVGIALGYGLGDRGSRVRFSVEAGNFSLHHCVQNGSGTHPAS